MFGIILPIVQTLVPAFFLVSSIYFQSSPVSYRIPFRKDQQTDYSTQPLKKYLHSHIGYKPESAPPRSRAGWHGRAPFIACDGKTILQEFFSVPYSAKPTSTASVGETPKALVILFAGLGDSVERQANFADELARFVARITSHKSFSTRHDFTDRLTPFLQGWICCTRHGLSWLWPQPARQSFGQPVRSVCCH
jgi:hypothetical protein